MLWKRFVLPGFSQSHRWMYEPLVESARNCANNDKIGRSYNVKVGESVEMYYNPSFHTMKSSCHEVLNEIGCSILFHAFYGGWTIVSDIIYKADITIKVVITCI